MKTPHSSTNKGKRVKITLRNGMVIVGKFKDKKSGTIIISEGEKIASRSFGEVSFPCRGDEQRIHMSDVRAFSIYKPTT